jgi:2-methylcitrate dehydratase PrpD
VNPTSVHQAKFSMGTVLALLAVHGAAGLSEFEEHALVDPRVAALRERVRMVLDDEVNSAYPQRWIGKVEVRTTSGRTLSARVVVPKGDPGNSLTSAEIEDKAIRLAQFRGAATPAEMQDVIARVWRLEEEPRLGRLLSVA